MKMPVPSRSLSAADAAFLYLERKEIPLHIASVCVFDGPIPFREFVASINSKLHLVPGYRQIPVASEWSIGLPTWQDDPHFDIHRHIFRERLEPPGGEAELQALAGRLFSQLLDRNKPLWELHVVDGLKDGRGAIIWRLHHALADGISGVESVKILLDLTPEVPRRFPRPRFRPRRAAAPDPSLTNGIFNTVNSAVGGLLKFEEGLLGFAQGLLSDKNQSNLKGLAELLPEFAASVERLPFNKPCTGDRKFCWTEFDFAEVQAIRKAAGGTVNDVILAVLMRALARYVKLHGQTVVNRLVRIVCPVSMRRGGQGEGAGNQISFLPVALPMDVRNPVRMLQAVGKRTEAMKRGGAANLVGLAASWIAAAPPPIQALLWRGLPDLILPVPLFNMICTNVAGSQVPLYAAGRRMIASYPQVPTGYDLGVGCAVQSYDGKLFFGLIADAHAAPDVDRLRDFLVLSFQELKRSAALRETKSRGGAMRQAQTQEQKPPETVQATVPEAEKQAATEPNPMTAVGHAKEAA
jgi:diacylglycerol O-acyltransferase